MISDSSCVVSVLFADVRETHKVVIKHIQTARQTMGLHDATAVLVLESNLA